MPLLTDLFSKQDIVFKNAPCRVYDTAKLDEIKQAIDQIDKDAPCIIIDSIPLETRTFNNDVRL